MDQTWSRTYSSSRSFKVDDFGANRNRTCDFLLVINSNSGPILHRFWDTASYWLKIVYFSHPSLIRRPRSVFPLKFHGEVKRQKIRVMGLLCGEGCVILTSTIFDWSTLCDGRTKGQTDGRAIAFMLSRAKNPMLCLADGNKPHPPVDNGAFVHENKPYVGINIQCKHKFT